jgi:hypothetical protein
MDIKQLIDFDSGLHPHMPRFLGGPAGLGKSSVVKMIAKLRGMRVVDLRLSELEPADLVGMPYVDKTVDGQVVTRYAAPTWWYNLENAILLLDELDRAREDMQPLAMQLTLDRRAGGRDLPASTIVFAAGNGLKYQTATIDQALCNRMAMIEFTPTAAEWTAWAQEESSNVHPAVAQFIQQNKQLLDISDADVGKPNLPVPSRRSWANFGGMLLDREDSKKAIQDIAKASNNLLVWGEPFVGQVAAHAFASWVKDKFNPLDIMDIFNGKIKDAEGFPITQVIQSLSDVMEIFISDKVDDKQRTNAGLFYAAIGRETFAAFFNRLPNEYAGIVVGNKTLQEATNALLEAKRSANAKPKKEGEADGEAAASK